MGRSRLVIECSQLKELLESLKSYSDSDKDQMIISMIDETTSVLFASAAQMTHVVTGNLQIGWKLKPARKRGNLYIGSVYNNTNYASWVEKGHRTVNDLWVPGQFMLKKSTDIAETHLNNIANDRVNKFLEGYFL